MIEKKEEVTNSLELSIIVPVFNAEKYLSNCIKSIINQEYKNFELIIIDDGSSDNSKKICSDYIDEDNRISYYYQNNQGSSSARNYGISLAKGKYIAFVDADDMINKYCYSSLMKLLKDNDADVISFGYKKIEDFEINTNEKIYIKDFEIYNGNNIINEYFLPKGNTIYINVWSKIYKASLFNDIKFDNNFFEDLSITYKLLSKSKKLISLDNAFYYYFISNTSSLSHDTDFKKRIENRQIYINEIKKYFSNNNYVSNELNYHIINQYIVILKDLKKLDKNCIKDINELKLTIIKMIISYKISFKLKIKLLLQAFFPRLYKSIIRYI